jgi:hypothetical protein
MQTLVIKRKPIDLKQYCNRRAAVTDCAQLLTDEFKLIDEESGKVVAVYCKPSGDDAALNDIFDACRKVNYQTTHRTNGLKTTSRIFGFNPRKNGFGCAAQREKPGPIHGKKTG